MKITIKKAVFDYMRGSKWGSKIRHEKSAYMLALIANLANALEYIKRLICKYKKPGNYECRNTCAVASCMLIVFPMRSIALS